MKKIPVQFFIFLSLVVFLGIGSARAQTGYIYLHKAATDEESSPDFPFTITGPGGLQQTYSLNDKHLNYDVEDIGATNSGGLYATISGAPQAAAVYYLAPAGTSWAQVTGLSATRIDGGPGNQMAFVDPQGNVSYYNGSAATLLGTGAVDVAFDKSGTNRVFITNTANEVYYTDITGTGGFTLISGIAANRVDVAPNGQLVFHNPTNGRMYISNFDGSGLADLGDPNTNLATRDIAITDNGMIFRLENGVSFRYNGGLSSGGSWTRETQNTLNAITGGPGGQLWGTFGLAGFAKRSVWVRTSTGKWIDDMPVRTEWNANSVMVPVSPGQYVIRDDEATSMSSAWKLDSVQVYAPTAGYTVDLATSQATVNVAAGEVVHLIFNNSLKITFPVNNSCAQSNYLETFGSGAAGTYGTPLAGQTNYHFTAGDFMQDGYYTVAGNAAMSGIGSYNDHSSGDGTGRMMLVNASFERGVFFHRQFTGLIPGETYSFSLWAMSLNNGNLKPNIKIEVSDPQTNSSIASTNTGNVPGAGEWHQYTFSFTTSHPNVELVLRNNNTGGVGNDLAIDDISFGVLKMLSESIAGDTVLCRDTTTLFSYANTTPGGTWSVSPASVGSIHPQTGILNIANGSDVTGYVYYSVSCVTDSLKIRAVSNCSMPVTLVSFKVSPIENDARLIWSTSEQVNSDYFEIERSADAKTWTAIGRVKACGDCYTNLDYAFSDKSPNANINYYRLRMVDLDGTFAYSKIESLAFAGEAEKLFVFPNPVAKRLFLSPRLLKSAHKASITDKIGRVILRPSSVDKGIDIQRLSEGLYFLRVQDKEGGLRSTSFIVSPMPSN